jgi:hypothetical protein
MTRAKAKNRINKVLRESTAGLHNDDSWIPVYTTWREIEALGFEVYVLSGMYTKDDMGNPNSKICRFNVEYPDFKKQFECVFTAHSADTVSDPLSKYDIPAYVS